MNSSLDGSNFVYRMGSDHILLLRLEALKRRADASQGRGSLREAVTTYTEAMELALSAIPALRCLLPETLSAAAGDDPGLAAVGRQVSVPAVSRKCDGCCTEAGGSNKAAAAVAAVPLSAAGHQIHRHVSLWGPITSS